MGRGRQRAKQRKVARDLKYFSPDTDYAALERELTGHGNTSYSDYEKYDQYDSDEDYDAYAEYAAKYDIDDDEENDHLGADSYKSWDD
ncbi:DUF3073 domain-containing protein [Arcanobacterium hippocoleae]|uniref:DUF3073 domain-containing protein n=1 Tax=Arcanobacterium hippocoleae TaxID=149017 RepID=A0ABU1T353_9ACTO|nr:DUF3073 domain-containing protein [Arcanobacterium hippocoleae]MDR6939733.1 hypothetical protein [Arcanobacterium hippocoleae]